MIAYIASILYLILISIVITFQILLVIGLPLGEYAMGGHFPGKFPFKMRIAAIIQIFILSFLALIILIKGHILLPNLYPASNSLIWLVFSISIVSCILNFITKSKKEKRIWFPLSILLLLCVICIIIFPN
jgi:hypothetical protein